MMKAVFLFLALLIANLAAADYLIVSRSATIKSKAQREAFIRDRVSKGDTLLLLQDNTKNGYYNVLNPASGKKGWIFRSLARRFRGDIPNVGPSVVNGDLIVDVVDVGGGLCTVITMPNGEYVLYDAGHFSGEGWPSMRSIQENIPATAKIKLMVLSHTDADHLGAAGHVLKAYDVETLVHTGYERSMISRDKPTGTYDRFIEALEDPFQGVTEINLNALDSTIAPGTSFNFGEAKLTFLCGFPKPRRSWSQISSRSKKLNSVSIVCRLDYKGKSILFGGDAVGKLSSEPIATEKFLLDKAGDMLNVDVTIAPHHGADNGSSTEFIKAMSPKYVIFSAGHAHEHPRASTVKRYRNFDEQIVFFRTDHGDDEQDSLEWQEDKIDNCIDGTGDDDVRIKITKQGALTVRYLNSANTCEKYASNN